MMNFLNKKWFTLVELIFAITIFMIATWAVYMNFSYYQNKMNVKLSSKDISQALYNARNLAINWLDSSSWNLSVWVYFDKSVSDRLSFFTYPYDLDINAADLLNTSEKKLFKEIRFYQWVQLNNVEGKDKFMFLFQAITWSWAYYYWDSTPWKKLLSWDEINISIWFKWTTAPSLSKNIKYITKTNIVDY